MFRGLGVGGFRVQGILYDLFRPPLLTSFHSSEC